MSDQNEMKLAKTPFYAACFFGDAILLGCAWMIYRRHTDSPLSGVEAGLFVFCGVLGALLALIPFVLEYRAAVRMVETGALVSTLSQLQGLEEIANKIGVATSQWQGVQEHSARTTATAKEIAERIGKEAAGFTEFLQKTNDNERANLRLEIDKLRRSEAEWLQVMVRFLDHIFALHQAGLRSGQPALIEQLGQFQNACRDVARRIGLAPFIPTPNEFFNPKCHTTGNTDAVPAADAKIGEILATGYTFQGQLIRPALVSLQELTVAEVASEVPAPADAEESDKSEANESEIEEQSLL